MLVLIFRIKVKSNLWHEVPCSCFTPNLGQTFCPLSFMASFCSNLGVSCLAFMVQIHFYRTFITTNIDLTENLSCICCNWFYLFSQFIHFSIIHNNFPSHSFLYVQVAKETQKRVGFLLKRQCGPDRVTPLFLLNSPHDVWWEFARVAVLYTIIKGPCLKKKIRLDVESLQSMPQVCEGDSWLTYVGFDWQAYNTHYRGCYFKQIILLFIQYKYCLNVKG